MIVPKSPTYGREHLESVPTGAFHATMNVASHFNHYFELIRRHTLNPCRWWYSHERGLHDQQTWNFHIGWASRRRDIDGQLADLHYTRSGHSVESPLIAANACSLGIHDAWGLTNVRSFEEWFRGADFFINP